MTRINNHYTKLQAGYLFPEIGRRVSEFAAANPDANLIKLGIGDVVLTAPDQGPTTDETSPQTAARDQETDEPDRATPPEQPGKSAGKGKKKGADHGKGAAGVLHFIDGSHIQRIAVLSA